jgi:hypothetical protein
LLDLHTREIFISRHIVFHEHILPYPLSSSSPIPSCDYFHAPSNTSQPLSQIPCTTSQPLSSSQLPCPTSQSVPLSSPIHTPSPPRVSTRPKHPPSHLHDYVCSSVMPYSHDIYIQVVYTLFLILFLILICLLLIVLLHVLYLHKLSLNPMLKLVNSIVGFKP